MAGPWGTHARAPENHEHFAAPKSAVGYCLTIPKLQRGALTLRPNRRTEVRHGAVAGLCGWPLGKQREHLAAIKSAVGYYLTTPKLQRGVFASVSNSRTEVRHA